MIDVSKYQLLDLQTDDPMIIGNGKTDRLTYESEIDKAIQIVNDYLYEHRDKLVFSLQGWGYQVIRRLGPVEVKKEETK